MFAHHLFYRTVRMAERSDTLNHQSTIINQQSGSGFAGFGYGV